MSASKLRGRILVVLWAARGPLTLQGIAEKVGLTFSSTMEYLMGLIKVKYVSVTQEDQYLITNLGKQAIGMPKIDKDLASNILKPVSIENSFHFYYDLDQYSDIYAKDLKDFVEKIQTVDIKSIDFHVSRKDFELWIRSLGDNELAKKIELIRMKKISGENLRTEIHQTVNSRCEELTKLLL